MANRRKFLTRKRSDWVANRTVTLKGEPLRYPVGVEARYSAALEKAVRQMTADVERKIVALFERPYAAEYFSTDASVASQARLLMNRLTKEWDKKFNELAQVQSRKMVAAADKESKRSVTASLKKLSGGLTIKSASMTPDLKETIKSSVSANVDLIKSIERQYLTQVKSAVYRSIAGGNGLQDLVPYLEKERGVTERRAKNIALDQTRKVYSDMNADRMRAAKVTKYEWVHSGGGHKPREHHITPWPAGLNGGIFSLDDPPIIDPKTGERGKPGDAIACRCVMNLIIDFEDGEET